MAENINNKESSNEHTALEIVNEDIMMERGKFEANGYTFTVKPITLREEDEYFADLKLSPIPPSVIETGDIPTDQELGRWVIALFSAKANGGSPYPKMTKWRKFWIWLLHRNDYHYYSDCKNIVGYVKWIERKVRYKGKHIKFYQLEKKFELSKAEIGRLFIYLYQLTGF